MNSPGRRVVHRVSQEQLQALQQSLRQLAADPPQPVSIDQVREQFALTRVGLPLADGYTATPGTLGGVGVLRLDGAPSGSLVGPPGRPLGRPLGQPLGGGGVILYCHGGGYAIGSPRTHAALTSLLAAQAGANAISVDYRLAPEHPYPAGLDDALAVYRALLDSGTDPARVAFAGDSSGGGLATALLVAAREAGLPLPAAAVLFAPWTDLTLSGASITGKQDADLMLSAAGLSVSAADYAAAAAPGHPLISPLFADLTGLPPLLIQVGSHDLLLDDATRLAARAATADVEVRLEVTPGAPHVFQSFAGQLDEADAALASAGGFVRMCLGGAALAL